MSLSSGLVTITFQRADKDPAPVVRHWHTTPRVNDGVLLRRDIERGEDEIVLEGIVAAVVWSDEGVTIRVR